MHIFDYKEAPKHLLTPNIVNMLSSLHEFRGKQELYIEAESDVLTAFLDISETTIERTLKELLESGFVEKVGKGRATGYVRK